MEAGACTHARRAKQDAELRSAADEKSAATEVATPGFIKGEQSAWR